VSLIRTESVPCCFSGTPELKLCWMIHTRCNLRCPHCAVFDNPRLAPYRGVENQRDIARVVGFIRQQGIASVVVSGGEPTLSPWLLPVLQTLAVEVHEFSVSTNATRVTRPLVREIANAGLSKVTISLDGASMSTHDRFRGVGAFEAARRGIELFVNAGVRVTIGAFLRDELMRELGALADLCVNVGASRLALFRPINQGRYVSRTRDYPSSAPLREVVAAVRPAAGRGLAVSLHSPRCESADCPSGSRIFGAIGGEAFENCLYKERHTARFFLDTAA
jgi:MoaA/NifB/PqqE/SkfB family radical SAM enzyme